MKNSRVLLAGAVVVLAAVVILIRERETSSSADEIKPALSAPPAQTSSPNLAQSEQKPAKPVDVFFLSEDSARTGPAAEKPKGMRQPTVNGTRRIANAKPLTKKDDGHFISPHWSPDGLEVVFSKAGFNGIYTLGLNGTNLTQVTDKENVGYGAKFNKNGELETRTNMGEKQSFLPDGTPVDSASIEQNDAVVGTYTKDDAVYYRAAPGEAALPITNGDDRYYGGVVSPDGKYIAYNGLHTGLYVQPLDGSAPPTSLGEGYSPSWLPDGSGLVYNISQDDGHNIIGSDLYLSSVTGDNVSNLTETYQEAEINPSVSPDGTRVTYEADGVIYVADLM